LGGGWADPIDAGPFNELEYQQEKRRLQLPEFSTVFADLK
jgi:hypothetical protein